MSEGKVEVPQAQAQAGQASEEKRCAARRRFLMRGAAGSGVVIVTLYHQRAALAGGGTKKPPTIFTSSVEFCHSLQGTPVQKKGAPVTQPIPNPNNPSQKIPAFECTGVPDKKVPWNTGMKK